MNGGNGNGRARLTWVLGSILVIVLPTVMGVMITTMRSHDRDIVDLKRQIDSLQRAYDSGPTANYRAEDAAKWAKINQEISHTTERLAEVRALITLHESRLDELEKRRR